ncbi:hypothetical protein [Altericista sp. CCNU0014]|uniref:hypothetical protein n=1 Tax=Altericista sp. CCNU0014 TaxID=3082949 RepID=UPI00384FCA98
MGSLISELLNIHEGKYIVKAIIQVGGSTLATGLSAATSIEQAEDQARVRALVVLGIDDRPYATQAQIVNSGPEEPAARTQARLAAPAAEFLPLNEATFQHSVDVDWAIADRAARSFQAPEQQQLAWFERNAVEPEPHVPQRSSRHSDREIAPPQAEAPSPPAFAPQRESSPRPRGERHEAAAAIAAPIDLSDIIAHTDVELKRLGWTNAQGRRYLEQTYGKRSRQHLSDAELIEFLDHLKTQPTPGKPSL